MYWQLADANATVEQLKASVAGLEEQTAKDHAAISALRKSSANAERRAEECEAEALRLKQRTDVAEGSLSSVRPCV